MNLFRVAALLALAGGAFAQSAGVVNTTLTFSPTLAMTATAGITNFDLTLTGNVTSSTFNSPAIGTGSIKVCQDGTGARTIVWPVNFVGFKTIDTSALKCSTQVWKYDGTNVLAVGPMYTDNGAVPAGLVGLGTAALQPFSAFLQQPNDLSDLLSPATARANLGLGTAATQSVGTLFGTLTKTDALQGSASCVDAGSTSAYACNFSPAITSYVTGARYRIKANTTNTGASSFAGNGLSAITIKKPVGGSITTDLASGDIKAGQWVEMIYDGTNFQMTSQLGNAPTGTGDMLAASYELGASGVPANPCATAGSIYRDSSVTPARIYVCGSASGSWLGPLALLTGARTANALTVFDASGNLIASGCSYTSGAGLVCGSGSATGILVLDGVTSGSVAITVNDTAGTGTWTLPGVTDQFVGRDTTDTFTHKTFDTAATGNSLLINGLGALANTGTGSTLVRSISPTLSAPALSGASSGSTVLQAANTASGTMTLPSATDTLVGKATTDALTNKTLDSGGTGNFIKVGGLPLPSTAGTSGQRLVVNSGATAYAAKGFAVTCAPFPAITLTDSGTGKQTFSANCTLPANALQPGQSLAIDALYSYTTVASPSAIIYSVQLDSTDVYATASIAHTASITNRANFAHFVIGTDVSLSVSSAVETGGAMALAGFAQAQSNNTVAQPINFDTTIAHTISFSVQYAVANNNQSVTLRRVAPYAIF